MFKRNYKENIESKIFHAISNCCDDKKIFDIAKKFKAKCILTSKFHNNGTERITEVLINLKENRF